LLPRSQPEQQDTSGADTDSTPTPKDQPGGGGGKPTQGDLALQENQRRKCQRSYYYAGLFKQFETKIARTNIFTSRNESRSIATEFLVKYQDAVQELGNDFSPISEATRIYKRIDNILDPNRPEGRLDNNQIKSYINGYILGAFDRAKFIYNNRTKCPSTAGATVLQKQVPVSSPANL
jgi:hypothetical protein